MSPRVRALVSTAALAVAVSYPLTRPPGWDDFPISSYPMFSRADVGHVVVLTTASLVDARGARAPAPPAMLGTPEPMVAQAILARGDAKELCARVARAAAADAAREAVSIEIATSVFDTHAYFAGPEARTPVSRAITARCEVPR